MLMKSKFLLIVAVVLFASCGGNDSTPDYDSNFPVSQAPAVAAPENINFRVNGVYPHDPTAFTQGLEIYDGKLYEGTGELGKSRLRIVDIESGKAEKDHLIKDPTIFGEGITIFKGKLYQLTWQNKVIYEYELNDLTKPVVTYNWNGEGWGLTHDEENLIISDGTSKIYFVTPNPGNKQMNINKVITVVSNQGEVDLINELEMIDGFIFANVWFTDNIIKINPENGHIVGVMNLKGLLKQYYPQALPDHEGVLNGIAFDSTSRKMYITGKNWPKLFEIQLQTP